MKCSAAVFTISDSSHAGKRQDVSGPAVRARLEKLGWTVRCEVIPDEAPLISKRLSELADSGAVSVIFTTGGTGVALRDVTPEATKAVIEREIPGFGEWIRMSGHGITKTSILSRGISGTRGKTLIVNLPGSPRGAVESLNAIMDVVPHVVDLLYGNTEHTTC
ncbi:MAG: MogA/MoaB family molybdenum cofactor biosynthesis protein [Bryobacteraceae bacterium]